MISNNTTVIIRVDSAEHIGTGHVMRCLALARLFRRRGVSVYFLTKPHKGHCLGEIKKGDFPVVELPLSCSAAYTGNWCPHASWLGGTEQEDAAISLSKIHSLPLEANIVVVVDHFSLTNRWHQIIKKGVGAKIVVIDGLADRALQCDVLIDPNLVLDIEHKWAGKLADDTSLLVGPEYFPLRDEFNKTKLVGRNRSLRRILICFGGMDKDNATLFACRALSRWIALLSYAIEVDVVIGQNHPNKMVITGFCSENGFSLHIQAKNVSLLMANADLAIGGGGTMSWERCKMALPSLIVTIAQNQVAQAVALEDIGGAIYIGDYGWSDKYGNVLEKQLLSSLDELKNTPVSLQRMSARAFSIMEDYDHDHGWLDNILI